MAITNLSVNHTQKTLHRRICTAAVTVGTPHPLTYLSVLNIFLSMTAFLGNLLILVALHKMTSLHPPSKLLLRCLAITDLLVGLIAQPIYDGYEISLLYERWDICRSTFASSLIAGYVLCGVSLPTLGSLRNYDCDGNGNVTEQKNKIRRTMAVQVRYNSWYISLPSPARQRREMTKFCVV